jgi:N-acetyl-anhydromuramyl-L-alanine amidase AmpD
LRKIDGLVIHRTEAGYTGDEVKAAEAKHGLGYHYFVGPQGMVYELYPDNYTVWHARNWSHSTIAIAVYGDFHNADASRHNEVLPAQWASLVCLCKSLIAKYGFLFIMGHTELADATNDPAKVCPGENLNVRTLAREVYGLPDPRREDLVTEIDDGSLRPL